MSYVQATQGYVIDRETFHFHRDPSTMTLDFGAEVSVPMYLWGFPEEDKHIASTFHSITGGHLQKTVIVYKKSNCMWLNNLEVWFSDSYHKATVQFHDKIRRDEVRIDLDVWLIRGMKNVGGATGYRTVGANYNYKIGEQFGNEECLFANIDSWWPYFKYIDGFGSNEMNAGDNKFILGLSHHQFDIVYRGRSLNGKCYALLCGTWAVLLTDELEFDALVWLDGANRETLYVHTIAYTTNPYLMKVKMVKK